MKLTRNQVFSIAILLSFAYGIMVGKYHFFPHDLLKFIQDKSEYSLKCARQDLLGEGRDVFNEISKEYKKTDVKSLIYIHSTEDLLNKRKELIQFIFGNTQLPFSLNPSYVECNIIDKRYSDLYNLKKIDKITIVMEYGINSIAYFFHPLQSNNRVVIYCEGHDGDFVFGKKTINFFLCNGYSVVAFAMPLLGMNNNPTVFLEKFGWFKLELHDHLKFLNRPIRFFVEPVVLGINYLSKEYNYNEIAIVGFSSGGWVATLVAAIDPRISKSFPVAASYPIFLRSDSPRDYGDFEQTCPELYRIANYLELYIMGSYGKGRKQVQIINKYDPCCFAGIKYRTYESIVSEVVNRLGEGKFGVILDDTHREHKISVYSLKKILQEIES